MTQQKKKKKEFRVDWSRTYVAHGAETIFAYSKEEAEAEAVERLPHWEGHLEVVPGEDRVFVYAPLDLYDGADGPLQSLHGCGGSMRVSKHDEDADGDEQLAKALEAAILDPHPSEFDKPEEPYEEDEE